MTNANSNIRFLADYRKPNEELNVADVKVFLDEKHAQLRTFEKKTLILIGTVKHSTKEGELLKNLALRYELALLDATNWLEDKISETGTDAKQEYESLLEACTKLKKRNDDIKKNINDDLAACRHAENKRAIDPSKIVSLVITAPIALYGLTRASGPNREIMAIEVGAGAAIVGMSIAFRHQANSLLLKASKAIPPRIAKIKINTRGVYVAAALGASVLTKKTSEIRPSFRPLSIRQHIPAHMLVKN